MNGRDEFALGVLNRFRDFERVSLSHSYFERKAAGVRASAQPVSGHPAFANLELGESSYCYGAALFFDLAKFTWRTFWEPPEKVRMLAQAVLGQLSLVVQEFGGYVVGLRGDGLFACFGSPGSQGGVDIGCGLGAAAYAMDATQNALNQLLEISDIAPVQLRVGADYGRMDFTRTGTTDNSEINIVSFAANFAAKCEKYANAWEVVVGEGLADEVSSVLIREHNDSPKRYTRLGETKQYRFYDFSWRSLLAELDGTREALRGRSTGAVKIH